MTVSVQQGLSPDLKLVVVGDDSQTVTFAVLPAAQIVVIDTVVGVTAQTLHHVRARLLNEIMMRGKKL